jgi:hydroxymethylpyrimidine pyrophosphatase-like HAD family hydrolase
MAFLSPFIATLSGVAAQRAGRYMRLADNRYCKGTALRTVAESWQVPESRWAMLGDGHNDLHAFRLFPAAFCGAPATAHADVRDWLSRHGGYVSPEPGVMDILRTWHATVASVSGQNPS